MPTGTGRWGTVPWGTSSGRVGSGLVLDVLNSYNDVIYRLGFTAPSEVTSTAWVTATELFQWADEAVKHLAYEAGIFVAYDNSVPVVAGTPLYNLPAAQVFTLAAALLYAGSLQLLRLSSVGELYALDGNWPAATGAPKRCSMDAGGPGSATLYPQPVAPATLGLVCQEVPGTVSAAASTLSLPTVLQDYFSYQMLAGARGKESDSAMPEMAMHFRQRCQMYEAVMAHLFGPGQ